MKLGLFMIHAARQHRYRRLEHGAGTGGGKSVMFRHPREGGDPVSI
jgi:hypothetical protein